MCSVERCCYLIKIDVGCILIGITSFLFSGLMLCVATLLMCDPSLIRLDLGHFQKSMTIIFGMTLLISALNMAAAILMVIGVIKRKAGFLLCFFGFGIFITILSQLSALLLLLDRHWEIALSIFGVSLIYIHFLVVVHTMYDVLQKREVSEDLLSSFDQFDEPLIQA